MDYYLNPENATNRLLDEYLKYGTLVVAFDFDDTVYDYHKKGRTYQKVIELLKDLKSINCYLICWTGQENNDFVLSYLHDNNIPFDALNDHPPFHNSTSRKIYANVYLDDRAGLRQVYEALSILIKTVKSKNL